MTLADHFISHNQVPNLPVKPVRKRAPWRTARPVPARIRQGISLTCRVWGIVAASAPGSGAALASAASGCGSVEGALGTQTNGRGCQACTTQRTSRMSMDVDSAGLVVKPCLFRILCGPSRWRDHRLPDASTKLLRVHRMAARGSTFGDRPALVMVGITWLLYRTVAGLMRSA